MWFGEVYEIVVIVVRTGGICGVCLRKIVQCIVGGRS
jgi:hypothetical protein